MSASNSRRIVLRAIGHYHPPQEIPNSFFDRLNIGSDAQWIVSRTGIELRRSVLSPDDIIALSRAETSGESLRTSGRIESLVAMGVHAWRMLQQRLGPDVVNPETMICGTSVPDYDIPANAAAVAADLGFSSLVFDANSACSSFVLNLHVARSLLLSGACRSVGIVNPERYSLRMDYTNRSSCIIFGDGSAAALLTQDDSATSGLELIDTLMCSDPKGFDKVKIPVGGTFSQDGAAVQKFAVTRTVEVTGALLGRNGLDVSQLAYFIGHQANLRMLQSSVAKLGISPAQHLYNVDRFGNQGAAGAPAVLSQHWESLRSGDLVIVAVVGAGLTWGAALLRML